MSSRYDLAPFSDYRSDSNLQKYFSGNPLVQRFIRDFLSRAFEYIGEASEPGDAILNAGCGEGLVMYLLNQEFPERKFVGVDIDQDRLGIGRDAELMDLIQGDVYELPFASDRFDVVVMLEVLEHLQTPAAAIKEIKRVSRRAVVMSVPNDPVFRLGNLFRGRNLTKLGDHPDHKQHFTRLSFPKFLANHLDVRRTSMPGFAWTMCLGHVDSDQMDGD